MAKWVYTCMCVWVSFYPRTPCKIEYIFGYFLWGTQTKTTKGIHTPRCIHSYVMYLLCASQVKAFANTDERKRKIVPEYRIIRDGKSPDFVFCPEKSRHDCITFIDKFVVCMFVSVQKLIYTCRHRYACTCVVVPKVVEKFSEQKNQRWRRSLFLSLSLSQ